MVRVMVSFHFFALERGFLKYVVHLKGLDIFFPPFPGLSAGQTVRLLGGVIVKKYSSCSPLHL